VPTVDDYLHLIGLPIGGAVRVSLGLVSDIRDVERFLDFAERTYRDQVPDDHGLPSRLRCLPAGGPCVFPPIPDYRQDPGPSAPASRPELIGPAAR
jgi:hypothetical protein